MVLGGGFAPKTYGQSSSGGYVSVSPKDGLEFMLSTGKLSFDGHDTGFVGPGIEVSGSAGSLRPFADIRYIKYFNTHGIADQTIYFGGGASLDVLNFTSVLLAPEIS